MKRFLAALLAALLMMTVCCAEEVIAPDEADCPCEHTTIEVNGTTLYYGVAGEGKPVILVHGNGGSHTLLQTEANALIEAGYKVYCVDSRGQGANEPVSEYHYADMAEDYYQFITALGLEGCAYYGWSDGGIIGLMLGIEHPGAVSVMAVSGANLNPEGADPAIIAWIEEYLSTTDDPCSAMMLTEPDIDPEDLKKIEIPVLVTCGSEDVILPEHSQLIADSLPNAALTVLEGEGHETYIEGSDIMGGLLVDFLKENEY